MEKDILDIITDYAVNEGMDDILLNNAEYIRIQDKISDISVEFDKLGLIKEECLIVDRLIAVHVESGAYYGRMAYQRGFLDCVALLKKMDLIKVS